MKFLTKRVGLQDLGVPPVVDNPNEFMETKKISLPVLKYGYRSEPMTWKELQEMISTNDLAKMTRSREQQTHYAIFRYYVKQAYASLMDLVLCQKFGFPQKEQSSQPLIQVDPQWSSEDAKAEMVLAPNDFPYYTAPGILHYILWKTKQEITLEDIEQAKQSLRRHLPVKDILHWINPPSLQSLPEIHHAHFLCLLENHP